MMMIVISIILMIIVAIVIWVLLSMNPLLDYIISIPHIAQYVNTYYAIFKNTFVEPVQLSHFYSARLLWDKERA